MWFFVYLFNEYKLNRGTLCTKILLPGYEIHYREFLLGENAVTVCC